jgi:hypothetical protein
MWDLANTLRLLELDLPLLFGVATDDSHDYHAWGVGHVNPGRGWVRVRSDELSAGSIVRAMQRGNFYASSGVTLRDVSTSGGRYRVEIDADDDVEYTTRFIGTLIVDGEPIAIGEVLSETDENPATYAFRGDELYVRAVVVSSRPHPNPYAAGDLETAWLQPVAPGRATR